MKANGGDSLAVARASGELVIFSSERRPTVEPEDAIWTFVPPETAPAPGASASAANAASATAPAVAR